MAVSNCRNCGALLIDGRNVLSGIFGKPRPHECPPTWDARIESTRPDDSEWQTVYARDAEQAAEKFAETYDSDCGDYPFLAGGPRVVEVRREGGQAVERFSVYGESVPQYHANPMPAEPAST